MPFGQLMAEFSNSTTGGGWIHSVSLHIASASAPKLIHLH
jgi:hypothetical protein